MHLHEFQAKRVLAAYGIPVPSGAAARTPKEALAAAERLGGAAWVVKAQIHAGGRGKAGGVRHANGLGALEAISSQLLGSHLTTPQTGAGGLPVGWVLIEQPVAIEREFYLGVLIDGGRIVVIGSASGGMDIEQVAAEDPSRLISVAIDPVVGLQPYQCRQLAFAIGLGDHLADLTRLACSLYRLFLDKDASLVEVNPLVLTRDRRLVALDAKLAVDDNALYRQTELAEMRDSSQEEPKEAAARRFGLNYVSLEGDIACMVNGAGLAMATMDLIKLHGGEPANFLDVGGSATAERVAEAFKLILSDTKVKAILVNIFGGIVRCDLIAEGIIRAVQQVSVGVPVVVRLEGTQVDRGRALLAESGLKITAADDLADAAHKVVTAAREASAW